MNIFVWNVGVVDLFIIAVGMWEISSLNVCLCVISQIVYIHKDEEGIQLDDYLEKIHDNLYLSVANLCGEHLIHIRKYYLKDGCFKPKTEGCVFSVNQFAIFRDILHDIEERSWAFFSNNRT